MAKRKVRNHAPAFKFKLILQVLQGEKTRAEIAREHDITKSLLYKWEQAFLAKGSEIFSSTDRYQCISDKQFETVNLEPDSWHGEWNYTIHPNLNS